MYLHALEREMGSSDVCGATTKGHVIGPVVAGSRTKDVCLPPSPRLPRLSIPRSLSLSLESVLVYVGIVDVVSTPPSFILNCIFICTLSALSYL